jgi:hypothetical protein
MKHILHIFFNEHNPDRKIRYGETVLDDDLVVHEQIDLQRKPRAARFDQVQECGCGADGVWHLSWCIRQREIHNHPLKK